MKLVKFYCAFEYYVSSVGLMGIGVFAIVEYYENQCKQCSMSNTNSAAAKYFGSAFVK